METVYKQYRVDNFVKEEMKRRMQAQETLDDIRFVRLLTPSKSNVLLARGTQDFDTYITRRARDIEMRPFDTLQPFWIDLKESAMVNNNAYVYFFQSPWEMWERGDGFSGYLLEINEHITDGFYTYISDDRKRRSSTNSV